MCLRKDNKGQSIEDIVYIEEANKIELGILFQSLGKLKIPENIQILKTEFEYNDIFKEFFKG